VCVRPGFPNQSFCDVVRLPRLPTRAIAPTWYNPAKRDLPIVSPWRAPIPKLDGQTNESEHTARTLERRSDATVLAIGLVESAAPTSRPSFLLFRHEQR